MRLPPSLFTQIYLSSTYKTNFTLDFKPWKKVGIWDRKKRIILVFSYNDNNNSLTLSCDVEVAPLARILVGVKASCRISLLFVGWIILSEAGVKTREQAGEWECDPLASFSNIATLWMTFDIGWKYSSSFLKLFKYHKCDKEECGEVEIHCTVRREERQFPSEWDLIVRGERLCRRQPMRGQ